MDLLQEQVTILNQRIDALHQILEQVDGKTAQVLSEVRSNAANGQPSQFDMSVGHRSYQSRSSFDASMAHKDVLIDSSYPHSDSQSGERTLAPEVQIQRLTAQLTAAYNRIAALEEQLLAQRIHS